MGLRRAVLLGALGAHLVPSAAISLISQPPAMRLLRPLSGRASSLTSLAMQAADAPISLCGATVSSSDAPASTWSGDLLVLPFWSPTDKEAALPFSDEMQKIDEATGGALSDLISDNEFKGASGSSGVISLPPGSNARRLAVIGLGEEKDFAQTSARGFGTSLAALIISSKGKQVGVLMPAVSSELTQAALEAAMVGLSPDLRYKSDLESEKGKLPKLEALHLLGMDESVIAPAKTMAAGMLLTRGVVGSPANYLTPSSLAATASELADEFDSLSIKILEQAECEKLGMGAYLGVSQGAIEPPKFIHMTYTPPTPAKKKVVLIGKGLTFDSGGYNIKAGAGSMIEKMKFDMGGAGAVLGSARAVAGLAPEGVEVHFIVAACENMVSAEAMRPGDILVASDKKTIEVINTDAEGRLTLADALVYGEGLGEVDAIVDVATLTGACIIALGPEYGMIPSFGSTGGLWTSDDALGEKLLSCATETGELLWKMPLAKEYMDQLKSPIADLKNVGDRGGGSITAALFLKEFVKDTPWAHMDIAGPVWDDKKGGATGYGVRTLAQLVMSFSS